MRVVADPPSSQTEAEAIVEASGVDFEGSPGIFEPLAQALHQRSQPPTVSIRRDRGIRGPRPKPPEVDQDLGPPRKKASEQALRHGVAGNFHPRLAKGFEQTQPLNEGLEENRQDGGTVLASRKAELRQERHRLAPAGTQKAENPDPKDFPFTEAGTQHVAPIPPMDPQRMTVGAKRAGPCRGAEQAIG